MRIRFSRSILTLTSLTLVYALLSLLMLAPASCHMTQEFLGDGTDGPQNVWNMWWFRTALFEQHTNPYYTNLLYYPEGTTLLFQTMNPFNCLISLPLQPFFNARLVYNLIVLFSFTLAALGMYSLAYYLLRSKSAAFLAGLIFTFCPYHLAHTIGGHLQLIAMEWLPFYILALFRLFYQNSKKQILYGAIFMSLAALCCWYYLLFLSFFSFFFLVWHWLTNRPRFQEIHFFRRFMAMAGLTFFFLSPLLLPMIYYKNREPFIGSHDAYRLSADLLSHFVPGAISFWSAPFKAIWSRFPGHIYEDSNFLGFVVIAFSLLALKKFWQDRVVKFFLLNLALFLILSLGMSLKIAGYDLNIPLPYAFLFKYVPMISFSGVPERFNIMVLLSGALLSGYGLKYLRLKIASGRLKQALTIIVSGLVLLEYLCYPFPSSNQSVSPFYQQLAREPGQFSVIDTPWGSSTLYFQTIHHKPMVGGYITRPSLRQWQEIERTPIITDLMFNRWTFAEPSELRRLARQAFQKFSVRYVIVHWNFNGEILEKELGLRPVYQDQTTKVFRVDQL
jgi:hypothetical protein